MVLAQYYNFIRYGFEGYRSIMESMQHNARLLSERLVGSQNFELVGPHHDEQLPLVAFRLAGERPYDEFDVAWQLSAERGWMVPAYTLPPNANHVKVMRALCKETFPQSLVETLADDIGQALETLDKKGGVHEQDRKRVKTGTGY
jgi:glutamate decarboxylase